MQVAWIDGSAWVLQRVRMKLALANAQTSVRTIAQMNVQTLAFFVELAMLKCLRETQEPLRACHAGDHFVPLRLQSTGNITIIPLPYFDFFGRVTAWT